MKILARQAYPIAYDHVRGRGPCVIFCPGFNSNRQGNKALALEAFCAEQGYEYIRFDYGGHGESGGDFADGTISHWLADVSDLINQVPESEHIVLVGSSMGGWISLLTALALPERVRGLVLLACAADMTSYYPERLAGLDLRTDQKGRRFFSVPNEYDNQDDYRIYQNLLEDGKQHRILRAPIELNIPVRLIHGEQDDVVEWQRSLRILERLTSGDVLMTLIKDGDHRLSKEADLKCINRCLLDVLQWLGTNAPSTLLDK